MLAPKFRIIYLRIVNEVRPLHEFEESTPLLRVVG